MAEESKPVPPPLQTEQPVTPPPSRNPDAETAAAPGGTAETAHSGSVITTPPSSPSYQSPTFSSEQHAKYAKSHVCFRCHPESWHEHSNDGDEPHTPTKVARRRSSAASGHREAVHKHLGMDAKCPT